jgi:hypothetical protein
MRRTAFALVLVGVAWPLGEAAANESLMTEAVSNYGGPNLPNAIPNAAGFASGMTGWTTEAAYTDNSVYDSDFVDPEIRSGGDDTYNFDPTGNAVSISYFCGHGTCDAGFPGGCLGGSVQVCSHASDCPAANNPYTYEPGAGVCRYWPGGSTGPGYGYCAYASPRFIITNSTYSIFGNDVEYSDIVNKSAAWGESSQSGSWRSAGTNGGTNLVVLDLSNGMTWPFAWQSLGAAFAGVHMIATLAPTAGDTDMVADRGSFFASRWHANHASAVMTSWLNTMSSMPSEGEACGDNGVTDGGYMGFNGCGCNMAMVVGATNTEAENHVNETWNDIQNDSLDAKGASYYYYYGQCNYDWVTYPFTLP